MRTEHKKNGIYRLLLSASLLLGGCADGVWNNPNDPSADGEMVYYSMMTPLPPKHLDPAISYASDESLYLSQIYESPLGYHFLKRPYELIPKALADFPELTYLDADGQPVADDDPGIAFTRYTMRLDPAQHYQPHPSFAKDADGNPAYLFETAAEAKAYDDISDFPETDSRPVQARDFIYGIKRLADPLLGSPMLGFMSQYIVGMSEYSKTLGEIERKGWLDLNDYDMDGLQLLDDSTFSITIKGRYPQFRYWLAMHFFAPIPWEADRFYNNPGFADRNLVLDRWPVGSGPYMMTVNNPNMAIVLEKNPNYAGDTYPTDGEAGDAERGLLDDAGRPIPFIDKAVYKLEREVLPLWTKFLQGYYDRSGESHGNTSRVFDQAFVVGPNGLEMSEEIASHNITMSQDVKPGIFYYGFNMRDPVLGGMSEERRKLRRALQIAFDTEEYLKIFYKGNGIAAHSPIPPGIPGHFEGEAGMNPYVYDWVDGAYQRKPLAEAKQLLIEAGYPNGRDARSGEPLRLFMDVQSQAIGPAMMNWVQRQFEAIGVQVEFRPADWNRTREKFLTGNTQVFSHGWLADYPDPENFMFLLYGPESPLECSCDGVNNANYNSEEYDSLFREMRVAAPGPERDAKVARLVDLYQRDAVWLFGYFPKDIYLNNPWIYNTKRHGIDKGVLKYLRIDPAMRDELQQRWNPPVTWPLFAAAALVIGLLLPGIIAYRRRLYATARED